MRRQFARPRLRAGRPSRAGVVAVVVVALVAVAGLILAFSAGMRERVSPPDTMAASGTTLVNAASAEVATASIEVPQLLGMPLDEAKVLLSTAGLVVRVRTEGEPLAEGAPQLVESQRPGQGSLVGQGETVALTVRPRSSAETSGSADARRNAFVVCIDPGHQSYADESPEPIGPKSKELKPKAKAGITGVKTGMQEYEIALQIATNLKKQLESRGVRVVMTRTTNDVNLSNADRAQVANKAKADLFVRIHGDGSPDPTVAGVGTLYPASNTWTKPIAARSRRAAVAVQRSVASSTGAPDRGTKALADQAGFNWSRVPAVLVECGYLSNPVEDRLLASPQYQDRIAQGLTDGILAHLEAEESR